jgi:hypothetical protein
MKNKQTLILVISILVGLGVGFGGGYFVRGLAASKARSGFAATGVNGVPSGFQRYTGSGTRAAGQGAAGSARMAGGGAVNGTILSTDAKSLTVKMADGSTKIVLLSGSTAYSNTQAAAQGDLKTGSTVAVFGTANSDGSVTATTVQINPMSFRLQGSPAPTAP